MGIYVELKQPQFHRSENMDIVGAVLGQLYAYGYRDADDRVYLQCFDASTLQFLNDHTAIRLVQLLRDGDLSERRIAQIATYADAVGVWTHYLKDSPEFVAWSQDAGLPVHAFSFRADQLPQGVSSYKKLLDLFIKDMRIDGLFSDHTDLTVRYLQDARR